MFLRPRWARQLPEHIVPPDHVIRKLESLRKRIRCPHNVFSLRVAGSRYATRRTMYTTYGILRCQNSRMSEHDILIEVCRTRLALSSEESLAAYTPERIVSACGTLDEVVEFFLEHESTGPLPDRFGWGEQIETILNEQNWLQ